MARKISGLERRVWDLHSSGFSISQISGLTKLDQSFVHTTIIGFWREGGVTG